MSLVEGHGTTLGEFNPSSTSEPTENFFFLIRKVSWVVTVAYAVEL